MPIDNLNPEKSYGTYMNFVYLHQRKRHYSVVGSIIAFAELYLMNYFTSE